MKHLRYIYEIGSMLGNIGGALGFVPFKLRGVIVNMKCRYVKSWPTHVTRTADGLNLLGYVVFPECRRLRNDNGHRFVRRFRRMARASGTGRPGWTKVAASVQSGSGEASLSRFVRCLD